MSERLLNTAEAARFLRVSQASIRRWSDSALLPARRVGRRRERRFSEADLRRFLGAGIPSTTRATSPTTPLEVNVGGTPVPAYSHLATFYNTDEGRLRMPIPFFGDGLRAGHKCFLEAEGEAREAYLEALGREEGIDLEAAIHDGSFVVSNGPGSTVEGALAFWEQSFAAALAAGPTFIRVVGDMASERHLFESDDEMMRYENAYTMMAKRFPSVTLCQYDVRAFSGETIYQALRAHPDLYSLRIGSMIT
ncbi:MAG TPA: MEDS domain-containing protein [Candidatus Dormibacteraeota bacterium]